MLVRLEMRADQEPAHNVAVEITRQMARPARNKLSNTVFAQLVHKGWDMHLGWVSFGVATELVFNGVRAQIEEQVQHQLLEDLRYFASEENDE